MNNDLSTMYYTINNFFYKKHEFSGYAQLIERQSKELYEESNMYQIISKILNASNLPINDSIDILSDALYEAIRPSNKLVRFIQTTSPDIILSSPYVDGNANKLFLLKAARILKIPFVAVMASWDNLESKNICRPEPDTFLTWTKTHSKILLDLHHLKSTQITEIGSTILSTFKSARNHVEAINDKKSLSILYLCSSNFITSKNEDALLNKIILALEKARNSGTIIKLTIRLHPQSHMSASSLNIKNKDWINLYETKYNSTNSENDLNDFIVQCKQADTILGVNTSAMLDALVLGRCVLSLNPNLDDSIMTTMHSKFLNSLVFKIIDSFDDLVPTLNAAKSQFVSKSLISQIDEIFGNNLDESSLLQGWESMLTENARLSSSYYSVSLINEIGSLQTKSKKVDSINPFINRESFTILLDLLKRRQIRLILHYFKKILKRLFRMAISR